MIALNAVLLYKVFSVFLYTTIMIQIQAVLSKVNDQLSLLTEMWQQQGLE